MARINLSIPDELREEMKQFCPDVNWSKRFQLYIKQLIAYEKAIIRLRESKRKYLATVPHHSV